MWEEVFKLAVSNGIFAVLFCALLIYDLKVSGKREAKYQSVIQTLSNALTSLEEVKHELDDCERLLEELNGDVKKLKGKKSENDKNENYCVEKAQNGVLQSEEL